jgi:sporulation protein YlmC with PRC-barrel domain
MEISLGAHAEGKDGGLGVVERFIFNLQSQLVSDLVIRHGLVPKEHVVSLDCVRPGADGDEKVRIDLFDAELDDTRIYTEAGYRAADTHFAAPPAARDMGDRGIDYQLDEAQALGAVSGLQGKPMGYPGGETIVSDDAQIPVLTKGTNIFDLDGQHIGDVASATVDTETGQLTHLTMGGGLLRSEDEVPIEWLDKVGSQGVMLTMRGENVEHLKAS